VRKDSLIVVTFSAEKPGATPSYSLVEVGCSYQAWLLKNSFEGISTTKFIRKLLNVRPRQTLEFAKTTASVPFSTATGNTHRRLRSEPQSMEM
jgi:hypothetical protein